MHNYLILFSVLLVMGCAVKKDLQTRQKECIIELVEKGVKSNIAAKACLKIYKRR